jgi:hypothetical protein
MSNEEKETLAVQYFASQDIIHVKSVLNVNHKPHPYMIGPKHISYAADHCCGMLTEEVCKKVPCAMSLCDYSYEEHTSDTVLFLQLQRNCTGKEVNPILKGLVETYPDLVDGVAFVETEEHYRIL